MIIRSNSVATASFLAACLATSALTPTIALAASATTPAVQDFDITAQPLQSALLEFSQQSQSPVVASTALLQGRTAPTVSGRMDQGQALMALLAGTDLSATRSSDGGWAISRKASDPQGGSASDGAEGTVQALIVTAQKREENIQDVPIAMSAFTQEDLTKSQVTGGPDLMTQVPNFTFTKTNFTGYSIQIRGIGTQAISATTDAAVAVAENNTPFIRNRFFEQEFYDLQRVEVLRGPQGTLYGRNATAGVVNIITAKPSFHYEAKLSADVGNYSSTRLEGMVNLPLVDDKVALRVAGAWTKRDGYDVNQITGNRIDGRNLWSTRVSLRFVPNDRLDANLIWEHFEEDDDRLRSGKQLCKRSFPAQIGGLTVSYGLGAPGGNNGTLYDEYFSQGCEPASLYSPDSFEAPNGLRLPYYRPLHRAWLPIPETGPDGKAFDPYASTVQSRDLRVIESTVNPSYKAETNIVELQVGFHLSDNLAITSETGYLSDTLFSTQDYNRFNTRSGAFNTTLGPGPLAVARGVLDENGVFCDPQIGCADRLVAMDLSTATSSHFSEEVRLASDYDGRFNFSLGANFLRYDTEDKYYVFINTLSLYAAGRAAEYTTVPDYVPGVSDNSLCLEQGFAPPDPVGAEGITNCVYIDPNPIGSLNDLGHNYFLSKNPYKLISYAVFGEAYYNLTDNLKLTTGLRWTVDKKEAPRIPSWVLAANTAGYPVVETIRQEWREPTGRVTLDWKPDLTFSDETMFYASYAHGYKAGGANPPANGTVLWITTSEQAAFLAEQMAAIHPRTFKPEFVNAFELGTKNTLLGGQLTLNADTFYYDYTGYQISQIVNRSAVNLNFDAKIWGLELEADWRPVENLRLAFKGGYEKTRMADGSRAVDVMDRTAGHDDNGDGIPDWYVTGPFPTLASNCILPTSTVVHPNGSLYVLGYASGGGLGPCEYAYILGLDPVTLKPYVPNPPQPGPFEPGSVYWYPGYKGFNPASAPNGGAGFYKELSGHELPNAPHYTATITADYTLPLPNNWLATLHTDLYYQSEAWTRVFNTPGYDKLKAYTNVNLAAIFSNEDAGWKIMAYVKNVLDRDSITGAFLNSDDTGLTTNVFLTEPRLYGLRVTKEWTGGPWWTGANPNHAGPYPLTVELSGQVQRHDADYETLRPDLVDAFPSNLDLLSPQHRDLDWGDGREVKIIYRPAGSPWSVSGAVRYGRTNSDTSRAHSVDHGDLVCVLPTTGKYAAYGKALCDPTYSLFGQPPGHYYDPNNLKAPVTWSDASARAREEHTVVDFAVGRDVGLGAARSTVNVGIRYAQLLSTTDVQMSGVPIDNIPEGWLRKYTDQLRYDADVHAHREFKGAGPTLNWDAALPVLGDPDVGRLNIDWSIGAGVLFGRQETAITGSAATRERRELKYANRVIDEGPVVTNLAVPVRSRSVTVPAVNLSLGLSYDLQRIKVSTGYRWERYFNALDAGYAERKEYDRTIDGPYFKIAVGFGG